MAKLTHPHVIFLATSTPEKVRDFNLIAQRKRLPLYFIDFHELAGTLPNTVEDGTSAQENADKKRLGVKEHIARCRKDPKKIEDFLARRGIAYKAECIWFGAEDSGVTLARILWDHIPKAVFSLLPASTAQRLQDLELGPGIETAPFLSATLGAGNIQRIIEAGVKALSHVPPRILHPMLLFHEKSALTLESLLPTRREQGLDGKEVDVFLPLEAVGKNVDRYSESPYAAGLYTSNYSYMSPTGKNRYDKRSAAEMGIEYIVGHSARAAAVDDLVTKFEERVWSQEVKGEFGMQPIGASDTRRFGLMPGIAKRPEKFVVGLANITRPARARELILQLREHGVSPRKGELGHLRYTFVPPNLNPPQNADDIEKATFHLSGPERLLSHSDGIVLMPDSASPPEERTSLEEKLYLLESLVVAKQLVPRDMNKRVVIINTDHSWDKAIQIHMALANSSMTKEYCLPRAPEVEGVEITSGGYFDIINGGNYASATKAAALLMKERSLTYHRAPDTKLKTSRDGPTPYHRRDMTAIFCSASSENAPLNRFVSEIAFRLGCAREPVICGGGDRYTMGAILDGIRRARDCIAEIFGHLFSREDIKKKTHIAGISTDPIAASETAKGEISEDYNYRELTRDIYERMAIMLVTAKNTIVAPGGAGTIQEWMGFHLLKQKMPELFQSKKLVIFDPELLLDLPETLALKTKVFDDTLHKIFNGHTAGYRLRDHLHTTDIKIATTVQDVISACLGPKAAETMGAGSWLKNILQRQGGLSSPAGSNKSVPAM